MNKMMRISVALALIVTAGCNNNTKAPTFDTSIIPIDTDPGITGGCRASYGGLGFDQPVTFEATSVTTLVSGTRCSPAGATTPPSLELEFDDSANNGAKVRVLTGVVPIRGDVNAMVFCQDVLGAPDTTFVIAEVKVPTLDPMTVRMTPLTIDSNGQVEEWEGVAFCATSSSLGGSDPFNFPSGNPTPFAKFVFHRK